MKKCDPLPSVGGWLVWSVLKDWSLELVKCVLWKRLKYGNERGGCHLDSDGCINTSGAQTRVALVSEQLWKIESHWHMSFTVKSQTNIGDVFLWLAWNEKVVKVVEALTEQPVSRIKKWWVKAWMVYGLVASSGVCYRVLMLLLGCKGISLIQLRWLVGGA